MNEPGKDPLMKLTDNRARLKAFGVVHGGKVVKPKLHPQPRFKITRTQEVAFWLSLAGIMGLVWWLGFAQVFSWIKSTFFGG